MKYKSKFQSIKNNILKYFKIGRLTVTKESEESGERHPDDLASFERLYTMHPWAYAGIYAIASSGASVPIRIMRKKKDGKHEEVLDHPFLTLLDNPNDFMTGYDLIELSFIFLEATGESYWLYDDLSGKGRPLDQKMSLKDVKEIWPLMPSDMRPIPNKESFRSGFKYTPGGSVKGQTLSNAEVQYLKYANPLSMHRGLGSLQPAKRNITGELFAESWNNNFFKNGGLPAAFLKTDQRLEEEQRRTLKADLAKMYQGVQNAHKIALLESGLDLAVPNQSHKDMEFTELMASSMKKTLGTMGVPLIMVGLGDEQSYNNAQVQERIFWRNTMTPKFKKLAAMLTQKLKEFGESEDLFVVFDTSDVDALKADQKLSAETAKIWTSQGMPLNQALDLFLPGADPVEGGDVGLVPMGMIPITDVEDFMGGLDDNPEGEDPEGENPTPPEDDEGGKDVGGISKKQRKLYLIRWKQFIVKQDSNFKKMRRALKRQFKDQEKQVLSNILEQVKQGTTNKKRALGVDLLLFDLHAENEKMLAANMKYIRDTVNKFGADTIAEMEVSVSFNVVSPRVANLLRQKESVIQGINKTTQDRLRSQLADALEAGKSPNELADIVQKEFKFAKRYRAERIARTEISSSANAGIDEGQRQAVEQGSVFTHKRWSPSGDSEVRDGHRTYQVQKIGDPFDIGGEFLDHPGDPKGSPGNIINCFPGNTVVEGTFIGATRARYSGKMIRIKTRGGLDVSVTPNHPILTDSGFIPASEINKGFNLVCNLANIKNPISVVDKQNPKTTIEDIFSSLSVSGRHRQVCRAEDFHGDGGGVNGEIEIVGPAGKLLSDINSSIPQLDSQLILESSLVGSPLVSSGGSKPLSACGVPVSSPSNPSSRALPNNGGPALTLDSGPFQSLRIGSASQINSSRYEMGAEGSSRDSSFITDLFKRYPGLISIDEVVYIFDYKFSGHVYDLQSPYGWLSGNNIIFSNCRCTTISVRGSQV